jgi:CheY-like chemotaxis protein/anti-sigma regulatory factor (Ser/Thr protein kinase)
VDWEALEALPPVALPTTSLELVFANVLKNALEATSKTENPEVRISAEKTNDVVEMEVWNSGPPLPQDVLDRMTESFFTTKESQEGTGLGLALVKRLVTQAGGEVSIENAEGGGISVVLSVPVSSDESDESSGDASEDMTSEADSEGLRVLVVDDEQAVRDVLKLMMNNMGEAEVETCGSGNEALSVLRQERFDAVLLDLRMPDLPGEAVFNRLSDQLKRRVVFVTGDTMNSARTRFLSGTTQPTLLKPVSFEELWEAVSSVTSSDDD